MDVACQHCPSVYPISEQKLAGRLVRFRCKSCGNAIVVDGRQNPSRPPAAVTSVPPLSLANIAVSVAPLTASPPTAPALTATPRPTPALVGVARPSPPAEGAEVSAPAQVPRAATADSVPVPRLASFGRSVSDKPIVPPPLPSGFGINQNRAPIAKTQAAPPPAPSVPSAPVSRVAPSEPPPPPPFRAASQPHNPNPQEVDPSVYEDETVAMTATELEAAADAQSHIPDSERHVAPWAPTGPVAPAVLVAPAQSSLTPPPPPPWNPVAHSTGGGLSTSNPSVPSIFTASGVQAAFGESHPVASTSSPGFEYDPMNGPRPTRAESWSIGKNPAPQNPFTPQEWRPQPTPAPISTRTLASAEPPPSDNPWLFRGLLVVLGIGGVVLGGVLGNTWLRHLLPANSQAAATAQQTEMNPHLPGFDALGANERLEAAQAEAVNCLNADTAPLTGLLVARFRPTGELDALSMTGSVGTAPETPCIRSVFDKVKVPPFRGVTSQVEKALELRARP